MQNVRNVMLRKKLELRYRCVLANHFFNIYFLLFSLKYVLHRTGIFYVETINNVNVEIIFEEIINYWKVEVEVEVVSLLILRSLYVKRELSVQVWLGCFLNFCK